MRFPWRAYTATTTLLLAGTLAGVAWTLWATRELRADLHRELRWLDQ